jgi:hypothetical protein
MPDLGPSVTLGARGFAAFGRGEDLNAEMTFVTRMLDNPEAARGLGGTGSFACSRFGEVLDGNGGAAEAGQNFTELRRPNFGEVAHVRPGGEEHSGYVSQTDDYEVSASHDLNETPRDVGPQLRPRKVNKRTETAVMCHRESFEGTRVVTSEADTRVG